MKNKNLDNFYKDLLKLAKEDLTKAVFPYKIINSEKIVSYIESKEGTIYIRIEANEEFEEEKPKKKRGRPKKNEKAS